MQRKYRRHHKMNINARVHACMHILFGGILTYYINFYNCLDQSATTAHSYKLAQCLLSFLLPVHLSYQTVLLLNDSSNHPQLLYV